MLAYRMSESSSSRKHRTRSQGRSILSIWIDLRSMGSIGHLAGISLHGEWIERRKVVGRRNTLSLHNDPLAPLVHHREWQPYNRPGPGSMYLPLEARNSEGRTLVYLAETILLMVAWLLRQELLLIQVSRLNVVCDKLASLDHTS